MDSSHILDAEVRRLQSLPYRRELTPGTNGVWVARIPEFPGCAVQGGSATAALASLEDAMSAWLQARLASGAVVPAPTGDTDYSGKFMMRIPSWMHRSAAERALGEGVSLNRFVESALAYALGLTAESRANPATVIVGAEHHATAPVAEVARGSRRGAWTLVRDVADRDIAAASNFVVIDTPIEGGPIPKVFIRTEPALLPESTPTFKSYKINSDLLAKKRADTPPQRPTP